MLLLLVGISDQVIGRILKNYYFKQESGLFYRTTFAIDSTAANILVFGSSRASHHYVPEVFEENLNLSFYNSGRDGNYLLCNYAIFKSIVNRYAPKILIFDLNPGELFYEKTSYERLSLLLPYYKKHPEIRNTIELKSSYEKYKMFSAIYPFNSILLTIAIGNMELNRTRKSDRNGYVPLFNYISDTVLHKIEPIGSKLDTNNVNAVNDIVQYCNANNILLIFTQSPMFAKVQSTISTEYFENLTNQNSAIFLNFLNDKVFLSKPEFFQDEYHLNDKGAKYFSKLLCMKIKEIQENTPNIPTRN